MPSGLFTKKGVKRLFGLPVGQAVTLQGVMGALQLLWLREDPFFRAPVGDAGHYLALAQELFDGGLEHSPLFYAPGMTLLRAATLPLGEDPWPYHLLALIAGMTLIGLVVSLAQRVVEATQPGDKKLKRLAARWATALWLGFPMGFFFQAEPVFPLWAALGMMTALHLLSSRESLGATRSFLAGLALGGAALGQTGLLLLAPALALWLWWDAEERRGALWLLSGASLTLLPGVIFHLSLGQLTFLRAAGGFNFLIGNECGSAGVFHYPQGMSSAVTQAGLPDAVRAFATPDGKPLLSARQADTVLYARGLSELRACGFVGAGELYLRKLYLLFCAQEIGIHRQEQVANLWVPFRDWLPVNHAILTGAALVSLPRLVRQTSGRLMMSAALGVALSVLPFFVADRLRFPLAPILCVMGAVGLATLRQDVRTAPQKIAPFFGAGVFLAGALHLPPLVPNLHRLEALEWERLGAHYANRRRFGKAAEALDRCLTTAPESVNCAWMLSRALLHAGDRTGACRLLDQLVISSPLGPWSELRTQACETRE